MLRHNFISGKRRSLCGTAFPSSWNATFLSSMRLCAKNEWHSRRLPRVKVAPTNLHTQVDTTSRMPHELTAQIGGNTDDMCVSGVNEKKSHRSVSTYNDTTVKNVSFSHPQGSVSDATGWSSTSLSYLMCLVPTRLEMITEPIRQGAISVIRCSRRGGFQ